MVSEPISVTYLFDPLCGWCYGASPTLKRLEALEEFSVTLSPTGLFADSNSRPMDAGFADFAWSNDLRIGTLTGQPFSEAYQRQVLEDHTRRFDSGPTTRALSAVAMTEPSRELEALAAIQRGRYVEGLDITSLEVLARTLGSRGLNEAAGLLLAQDDGLLSHSRERVKVAQGLMAQMGTSGVPALVIGTGKGRRLISSNTLFGSWEGLLKDLRAHK
ncbi:protein-disulfide isomerase [Pseudomonas sp. S25]|uniref:Protein-disulfide isomerase n=1 Tax=Pseudomonas maioricensis TaxID=1766623 RepID=A0ABS9ZNW4_9PSED|nr:protein-disulfide isomerase [Pseudomonas sp. S25]